MLHNKAYPKRLPKFLLNRYKDDRIPMPTSLEGKKRWYLAKVIKKDVKSLYKWYQDKENVIYGDKMQKLAAKLLELYMDACEILRENTNERADFYIALTEIKNHEIQNRP